MTGQDEKTAHCEASMTATTQKRGYPDKKAEDQPTSLRKQSLSRTISRDFTRSFSKQRKNISLLSGGHNARVPGAPSPEREQSARVTTRTHAKDNNYESTPSLYGTGDTGAPSPADPQGARVITRTFESFGCSLTPERNQSNIRVNTRRKIPRLSA